MSVYGAKLRTLELRATLAEFEAVTGKIWTRTEDVFWTDDGQRMSNYRSVAHLDSAEHLAPVEARLHDQLGDRVQRISHAVRDDEIAQYTALIVFWSPT